MSAFVKIPLQLLILAHRRPGVRLLPVSDAADALQPRATTRRWPPARAPADTPALEREFDAAIAERRARRHAQTTATAFLASDARVRDIRARAVGDRQGDHRRQRYTDVNYVFPTFITTHMPIGLVGLMIAAIFAAAMSASGGELNALATATIIDFYRRHFVTQAHRRALPARCRRSRRSAGGCSRASWRCTRRIRARSSRS